jgi:tetratricopeptide (TPR) repeat protein
VHRECLAGRVAAGDEVGAARSRCNLAITYERQGHYREALEELEPALLVLHEHGERMIEAGTRATTLVALLNRLGRLEEARENLLLALETFEEIGTPFDRIRALCNLAESNRLLGRLDEALKNLEEAEALAERVRDRNSEALVTNRHGDVLHDRGDFAGAIDSHRRALEVFRDLGVRGGECEVLNGLGRSYLATGSLDRAREAFEEALVIADELGSAHQRARALAGVGRIVRSREHLAEAMSILEQVAPLEVVELKDVLEDWS